MERKHRLDINYLYFGIFLIIGIIISTLEILEVKNTPNYSKAFFLVYAYGQTILEIASFAILSIIIKKHMPKIVLTIFIAFTFIFFISHIIDLVILKIMDMTIWDGLFIALDENLENFIEMLHTTGIPFYAWIIFGILILSLPFLGIFIYKITDKISKKRKIPLYHEHFIQIFLCIPLAIFIWDFKASRSINATIYDSSSRALPWKLTFMQPDILKTKTKLALKKPKNEKDILALIDKKDLKIDKKPNIFIFVIESLRSDYITSDIAPNMTAFKNENISFERSLSNANNTHQSWFSFFYSNYPCLWKEYQNKHWKSGSTGLNILKKMDYKINVFAAPELKYYSMKEALFGKDLHLLDTFKLFPHYHPVEACDSDNLVMKHMKTSLKDNSNVYIAFLDSTHFLYSWPKDFETKFTPISDAETLNVYGSKDNVDLLKNRYKNSIYFIDSLIGSFFDLLKEKKLFNDSIIVITGDHGEEFYEKGHLFHASHLSSEQTNVPIYLKFGENIRDIPKRDLICHMDIFPSIFDYIFNKNQFEDCLKGFSIFEKTNFPFVITARYNASRAPSEFFIHDKDKKLNFRFTKKKKIFKKQYLEILSLKDSEDNELDISQDRKSAKLFQKALKKYFNK
ncbi:MAG: hypothetical protein K1060chlam1_00505 [Candidatus Anoxychlamydiales bacterium]|nr:hypothetical protein [Candidatus Anoxychlamydiales bacterium]